jgi:hypothetical protein
VCIFSRTWEAKDMDIPRDRRRLRDLNRIEMQAAAFLTPRLMLT